MSATDPGTALSSQLYDATASRWSDSLCAAVGVTTTMLPLVYSSFASPASVTYAFAASSGLPQGLPVVVGALDSAAELVAAGAVKPGDAVIRLASAGGVQAVVGRPIANPNVITYPYVFGDIWYRQAATSTCATAVRWARDLLAPDATFTEWDELAASAPAGSAGLRFEPHLAGERAPYWDPTLTGRFSGITLAHNRAHIARAVYEGTAFSIRDAFSALDGEVASECPLMVVGGGAHSALWLSILASVLMRPLIPNSDATSAAGAALLAWEAVVVSAARLAAPPNQRIVEPNEEWQSIYDAKFAEYVAAHRPE